MSKLSENKNFIDDSKGRKWSWGTFKFVGEFTTIDFFILIISTIIVLPLFFFISIWITLIIFFTIFSITTILIVEAKGNKLYELIFDHLSFVFKSKDLSILEFLEEKDDVNIYEIEFGFDITNLFSEEEDKIEKKFNNFYQKINGDLKIIKTKSTYRLTNLLKELGDIVLDKNKNNIKKEVIASYYENLDSFSKNKMPNLYFKFERMSDQDIKIALRELNGMLEVKKVAKEEWQAITMLEFNSKDKFKVKRNKIVSNDGKVEKSILKVNFERIVPSLFLNEFIYNKNTSFVIDYKTPNFEERQKVKKSIKKWSRNMEDEVIEGKNIIDKMNDFSKKEAKNEVMLNYLFNNDGLKFFNVYVTFDKDFESELSFKKQIEVLSLDLQIKNNFYLNPLYSKQKEYFRNIWFKRIETKWFPTNISTITNILPFQNESILNSKGAYIGTSGVAGFPFMFHPFRTKGISGFHTGIISKTGGGKSTLLKILIAADYSIDDSRLMIMDPKNEFKIVMETIGGKTIDVSRTPLNPLKLIIDKKENIDFEILDKVSEFKEFLFLVFEREAKVNAEINEKISLMTDLLKKFYEENKKMLLQKYEFIFSDFKKWLVKKQIKTIDKILVKFIDGSLSRFNVKDGIDFEKDSFTFELLYVKNIKDESIRNAIMFSITSKVINEIYANQIKQNKISFVIDEAGWFFKSEFLTSKIESIMVEARAFNTKITWATQNITDLINSKVDSDKLISIYSNTEHIFLGQIKSPQRKAINLLMKESGEKELTKSELSWLEDSDSLEDKGKFLYQKGGNIKKIKVDLSNQYAIKNYFFEKHQFTKEED